MDQSTSSVSLTGTGKSRKPSLLFQLMNFRQAHTLLEEPNPSSYSLPTRLSLVVKKWRTICKHSREVALLSEKGTRRPQVLRTRSRILGSFARRSLVKDG